MRGLWCWFVGHVKWVPVTLRDWASYESITLADGTGEHGVTLNYCTRCKRLYAKEF